MKVIENILVKGVALLKVIKPGFELTYEMFNGAEELDAAAEGKIKGTALGIYACDHPETCPDRQGCCFKQVRVSTNGGYNTHWCLQTPRYRLIPAHTWRGKWRIL